MADKYIDKFKYNDRYFLLDSGATHESNTHYLSGTLGNFKSNGTIVAEQGLFNKLIATNASIDSLDANNLTAQNATVVGLLDVQGQLKTNSWTNSNIATIEGNFFIAPTLGTGSTLTTGNTKLTISKTNNIWEITIAGSFLVNQIGAEPVDSSDTNLNQWSAGSKVLITGEIAKTDGIYPLGTLQGEIKTLPTMNSSGIATNITITKVTDNLSNTEILDTLGVGSYNYRNVKISLTQRYYSGMRPIGILMSAQGRSSKSFIDIYGGANILQSSTISGASSDYGGLAIPNVRIGNLRGLPNIRSGDFTNDAALPTGWGIYTDNGYFKGTIVSTSGEIGHFTIDANAIYSGSHSAYNSNNAGIFLGRPSSSSSDYYIAGGPRDGSTTNPLWYLKSDGSAKIGAMTLSSAGVLTLGSISLNASGTATIGPWTVNSTSIYKGNATQGTAGTGNMYFGNNGLSISNTFIVSNAGELTAVGANLKNLTIYDSSGNKRAAATTNGFIIYDGATTPTEVASFGNITKIGKTSGKNLEIGTDSFNFYNGTTLLGKIAGNDSGGINITSPNVNGYESYLTVSPQRLHMGISYNDGSDQLAVADLYYYVSSGYWGIPYEVRAYSLYQNGSPVIDEARFENGTLPTINGDINLATKKQYKINGTPLSASHIQDIVSGTIPSTTVSANSFKDVTINFSDYGKTFSTTPEVVVGLNSTSTAGKIGLVSVAVYSVSTTQFVARFFNADTSSRAPAAFWIATSA